MKTKRQIFVKGRPKLAPKEAASEQDAPPLPVTMGVDRAAGKDTTAVAFFRTSSGESAARPSEVRLHRVTTAHGDLPDAYQDAPAVHATVLGFERYMHVARRAIELTIRYISYDTLTGEWGERLARTEVAYEMLETRDSEAGLRHAIETALRRFGVTHVHMRPELDLGSSIHGLFR